MLGKLLAAFILIPLVEFTLLVKVAAATSFGTTFLIVIATGAIGSILARREGLETIPTCDGRRQSAKQRDSGWLDDRIRGSTLANTGINHGHGWLHPPHPRWSINRTNLARQTLHGELPCSRFKRANTSPLRLGERQVIFTSSPQPT